VKKDAKEGETTVKVGRKKTLGASWGVLGSEKYELGQWTGTGKVTIEITEGFNREKTRARARNDGQRATRFQKSRIKNGCGLQVVENNDAGEPCDRTGKKRKPERGDKGDSTKRGSQINA